MSDAPRVVHVSTQRTWRGGEQQLAYLIRELRHEGAEQVVLCHRDGALHLHLVEEALNHQPLPSTLSVSLSTAHCVARTARALGAHVVHAHDSHAHTHAVLAAQLFGMRTPIVVSRRVDFPIGRGVLSRWKYHHPAVRRILCVSEAVKSVLAPSMNTISKLHVVYDGIDVQRFSTERAGFLRAELGVRLDQPLVGVVAALAGHKDLQTFLRTAAVLRRTRSEIRFVVVGEGAQRPELEQMRNALGLDGIVHLIGFRNNVPQLLPDLDVFLFTSKTEGLGSSILDAMASGIPVVTTNAGGISEIVVHEKNALVANVGDATQLAHHVLHVLHNPELRHLLVAGALRTAQNFSVRQMARQTASHYRELAKGLG